jgi:DNA-directed RNA polymerase specialized sigma24 family protein
MENLSPTDTGIEKIVTDLSSFLVSKLNSLGYQRHGLEKDDLLQEIHIRIWKAYKNNHHNIQYFNAYIKKIVYSVFINEINRINKEHKVLETGGPCLDSYNGSNGCGAAPDDPLKSILVASIDGLNKTKQQVIKLRLEGFTFDEIARLNQWSYRKTCNIFYRGLKDLKRKLGEKGIHYED